MESHYQYIAIPNEQIDLSIYSWLLTAQIKKLLSSWPVWLS